MFDQNREFRRKAGDKFYFVADDGGADGDVAEQAAGRGVLHAALVAQFLDFANVVEHDSGKQQIGVEFGILGSDAAAETDKADDVFEQPADEGVVHHHRGGSAFQARRDGGVFDDAFEQALQERILQAGDGGAKLGIKFFYVEFGVG